MNTIYTNFAKRNLASLRLLLVMLLTLTASTAWGADVTVKWTASSKGLGSGIGSGTIKTGSFSWDYTRILKSGTSYTGWTENCIQLGKNGGVENITFTTSAIPGTIKSVSVECSSYNNAHKVSIKVGNNTYLSSTATAKWTTISTKTGLGTSSGQIVISFTDGSRALYIKSISVTYEEAATCTTAPTVSAASNSNITSTTATVSCSGGITSLGSTGCSITSYGFVYGTTANPTTSNTKVQVGTTYKTTGAAFSKGVTGLTANTTYYVRPYATNGYGTAYGTQTSFKTLELPKYTVTLKDDDSTIPQSTAGAAITLPSRDGCEGYAFAGWTKSWIAPQTSWTTTAPTIIPAGSYTPTTDESLYPVYTKITEGGNEELKTITLSPPTTPSNGYINGTKTDTEGNTWSYYAAINNLSGTFEFGLNSNTLNYNIGSPIFDGKVSSVSFKARNGSESEARKFLFCSTNTTAQPTKGDLAEISIPKSQEFTETYTVDLSQLNVSQFYIYTPKALGITAISVTYITSTSGSTTSYISVPNCCTQLAEVTDLEFSSITSNSITVGVPNTYAGKANASGYTFNCYSAFTGDALVATADENGTSHIFTGLTKNTTYYFTAIAKGEGDYCNSIETSSRNSSKTLAQYTVTLNPNGGTGEHMGWNQVDGYYTQTVEEGNSVTLPKLDDQIAYTFGGWSDGITTHNAGQYIPEADVELTAQWTAKPLTNYRTLCTYDIVLKNNYVDDDSKDGHTTITATHTSFSTANKPAAREGYEIEGYYLEPECTNKVADDQGNLVANVTNYTDADGKWIGGETTLYTKWTGRTYEVTLNDNGGSGGSGTITATYGSPMPAITLPTRTGYTFNGYWTGKTTQSTQYYDANGNSLKNWDKAGNTTTLYALWTANTNTPYVVKHYKEQLDGTYPAEADDTDNLTGTTAASVTPAVKSYEGFTAPSTQTVSIAADGSTVVTYQYTRNSYSLSWDVNSGDALTGEYTSGSVKYGASITQPNTPTRIGYTFANWSPEVPATMPAANVTCTAQWTVNTYTITLDQQEATTPGTTTVETTYGSALPSIAENLPTKTGYNFGGYFTEPNGNGTQYYYGTGNGARNWDIASETTLYAQWTPISYTIKWVVNGDIENPYATTNVEGDGALVLPAAPAAPSACSGKVFVGWTEATTVKKNGKDIIWVNTSTIPYDNKTYHAVFADEEELSIAGGDMYSLPTGWINHGTGIYSIYGINFDGQGDYIKSPALGYKDLILKIRAGYNGSEGSVLTFYAYKEDGTTLFKEDEITITPASIIPNDPYTSQTTLHEVNISANSPIKYILIWMTSKVSNIGMEYCEVFSTYSDYTTTCEYSPEIHITGAPIQITAAKDVWVQAASALTVTGEFLKSNEDAANVSIRAYTNNPAFQIKKGGVTGEGAPKTASNNALTLNTDGAISTDDWTGAIDVVYKPTQAGITETATLTVEVYRYGGSTVYTTNTYELQGRSLPEQFVIAVTNGSGNWFAVPADMVAPWGLGTHVPYPITVDDSNTPTKATNVSPQVIYQAAARTGNVNTNPQTMSYKSVPLASKGNYYLYGSKTSGSEPNTNIQTASFASSEQQKWFLDVVDWNTKQYNMHLHGDLTTNVLAYTTGAKRVGQYSATSGTTEKSIYLLPIGGEIEGDLMDIVDWNTNSITINMNGYTISSGISYAVNGGASNTLAPENQNTRYSFQHVYDRTYDIATPTLTPGEYLQLSVTMGSDHSNQYYQVPYIYSGNHILPTTLTRYDQVVVRDGCLIVEGAVQVNTIYVYPTAELRIAEGATLTANKIYMRTNAFQSAVLTDNGTINVGQLYYTRIVADKQNSFLMALPFESTIADMRLTTGETKTYNKQWVLYTYDAAQRAQTGATGNNWVKQSDLTHIQPHTSYELLSGSAYYREYCFPVAYTKTNANVDISVTAHTGAAAQADPIHGGWNAIASPYTQNIQPQWGAPEEAIKLTRLLDDNKTYYQYVPTIIEPATAFYYQTAQTANLQFTTTTLTLQTPQAVAAKAAQREETDYPTQWINIVLSKQNDCQDQTNIYIHPDKFVTDYETSYDLTKMMGYGNRAQCYTTMPCGKLSFNALPLPVATNGINMGIYAPQTETLTLSITPNNYIQNVEQILLQDHYTNQTTDLLHTPYSFVAQPGEDEERFTIFIKCNATAITTDNAAQHNSQAYAYTQPKKLFLANLPRSGNIVIYDAVGKQIIQQRITQTNMDFVLPTGNYYVKVVNESEVQIIPTIVK